MSQSFSISLLHSFAKSKAECSKTLSELSNNLYTQPWNDTQFFEIMQKLLALIPYDLYVMDEKYFHSLFYLIIKLAGFQIGAEIHTQQGRTDAALFMKEKIIIFEPSYCCLFFIKQAISPSNHLSLTLILIV